MRPTACPLRRRHGGKYGDDGADPFRGKDGRRRHGVWRGREPWWDVVRVDGRTVGNPEGRRTGVERYRYRNGETTLERSTLGSGRPELG